MTVLAPLISFGVEVSSTLSRGDLTMVTLAFRFVIGGRGRMVSDKTNGAANVAAAYIILRGEGTGAVFFFRCVVDGIAFFRVDLALLFLVEEGSNDSAATAIDGVIADNIPLQLL
eukprot:CAMPEP_0201975474 /NCGR_PEP_ID=MMETSP0904-20121228/54048_1 /ASSEMBLY_ACC=CAM_ASM_000553 /TAXON_ID=420261 /ORGANISM="Thalassiosira antarctica, Strain CCMP982" /LENGTH=114 /DNA_ID=CAMNT_0048526255 /DNA_START=112 /DNA_END=456 /DNA_ORIENTATION=-